MSTQPSPRAVSLLVDARGLHASGIGRFLREVLDVLFQDPRFSRVTLLGKPEELRAYAARQRSARCAIEMQPYGGGFYSLRAQLSWLRLRARGTRADVAFFPHYDAPLLAVPGRSVVAILDLIHFKAPEGYARWKRLAGSVLFRGAVSQASRLIAISESTRGDLVERIPQAAGRTEVVPLGVSPFFRPLDPADASGCAEVAGPRPFLLCVGNRKPHKNLVAAVETLARVREVWPELKLVVAGRSYPGWDAVRERAAILGVGSALVELSDVDDAQLRCLYGSCEALLFPSVYEGFGLPVLEAMACEAPVIASNRASVPEVAGDAALIVDPHDHRAMADAVLRLRDEPELRRELIARGRRRASGFTWERAARQVVEILYETATRSGGRGADPPSAGGGARTVTTSSAPNGR